MEKIKKHAGKGLAFVQIVICGSEQNCQDLTDPLCHFVAFFRNIVVKTGLEIEKSMEIAYNMYSITKHRTPIIQFYGYGSKSDIITK